MHKYRYLINQLFILIIISCALTYVIAFDFKLDNDLTVEKMFPIMILTTCSLILYRLNQIYWMMEDKKDGK